MTVYLIRHADALSRQEWAHDDHERPLTPKGFDQRSLPRPSPHSNKRRLAAAGSTAKVMSLSSSC